MTKTIEDSFRDWENDIFGFGYGTGEDHVLRAVKHFFELCPEGSYGNKTYDYRILERDLTPAVAWLLLNVFGNKDIIEYGTSTRHAWLTEQGLALQAFFATKTVDELVALTSYDPGDHIICSPDACNCGPHGYERGRVCQNPFWRSRR